MTAAWPTGSAQWLSRKAFGWSFVSWPGTLAHALGRLAEVLDAEMIIVGSRRGGLRSSLHEFLGGSVAAHLAHRQLRPVVVVPLPASEHGRTHSEEPRS